MRILSVLVVAAVAVVILASAVDVVRVSGESMAPQFRHNQVVFVNRLAYGLQPPLIDMYLFRWAEPRRGDVVFFHSPMDGAMTVKRAVAVTGDPVVLTAAGARIGTAEVDLSGFAREQLARRTQLSRGEIFVLGDNRLASQDSRHYGPIQVSDVFGTLLQLQIGG